MSAGWAYLAEIEHPLSMNDRHADGECDESCPCGDEA